MPKPGNWGDWATIYRPNPVEGKYCGGCIHCGEDGACSALPILVWDVGKNYWKKCKSYMAASTSAKIASTVQKKASFAPPIPDDCKYIQYIPATKQYICQNRSIPNYTRPCCCKCNQYIREVIYYQGRQVTNASYYTYINQQTTDKKTVPSQNNTSAPSAKTKKSIKTESSSKSSKKKRQEKKWDFDYSLVPVQTLSRVTTSPIKAETKEEHKKEINTVPVTLPKQTSLPANPKISCKYLNGETCLISDELCQRGTDPCLFYKKK